MTTFSTRANPVTTTRVLLADDHQLFVEGLTALLATEPGFEVVATVNDGREAVRAAGELGPHAVVMDISMPGLNGIEATRRIIEEEPRRKVLCVSMHGEGRFVEAVLDAGASGYLLKDCAGEELLRALEAVMAGQIYLSPTIGSAVVERLRIRHSVGSAFSVLTPREREVLQLLAEGLTTKQIASRLNVSNRTIATHREHIMDKLAIRSIAGLTKYAVREGLTGLGGAASQLTAS